MRPKEREDLVRGRKRNNNFHQIGEMKKFPDSTILVITGLFIVMFEGCDNHYITPLVGDWIQTELTVSGCSSPAANGIVCLESCGTVSFDAATFTQVFGSGLGALTLSGTYSIEGASLTLNYPAPYSPLTYPVVFHSGSMTWTSTGSGCVYTSHWVRK